VERLAMAKEGKLNPASSGIKNIFLIVFNFDEFVSIQSPSVRAGLVEP
jgi:hypothetical protein